MVRFFKPIKIPDKNKKVKVSIEFEGKSFQDEGKVFTSWLDKLFLGIQIENLKDEEGWNRFISLIFDRGQTPNYLV